MLARPRASSSRSGCGEGSSLARKARAAMEKALELDPDLAEAHAAAGQIAWALDWDWAKAERELTRAIELNPNSLEASLEYSDFLVATDRLDAAMQLDRARIDVRASL